MVKKVIYRKLVFLVFMMFIINLIMVSAYTPPTYIANPETLECKYYFPGEEDCFNACMLDCQGAGWNSTNCFNACADPCHYNPRPEGFTVDLGKTTDFENQEEACKLWLDCLDKGGKWNNSTLKCELPEKGAETCIPRNYVNTILLIFILLIMIAIYFKLERINRKKSS
jgi:hypothetical protein